MPTWGLFLSSIPFFPVPVLDPCSFSPLSSQEFLYNFMPPDSFADLRAPTTAWLPAFLCNTFWVDSHSFLLSSYFRLSSLSSTSQLHPTWESLNQSCSLLLSTALPLSFSVKSLSHHSFLYLRWVSGHIQIYFVFLVSPFLEALYKCAQVLSVLRKQILWVYFFITLILSTFVFLNQ